VKRTLWIFLLLFIYFSQQQSIHHWQRVFTPEEREPEGNELSMTLRGHSTKERDERSGSKFDVRNWSTQSIKKIDQSSHKRSKNLHRDFPEDLKLCARRGGSHSSYTSTSCRVVIVFTIFRRIQSTWQKIVVTMATSDLSTSWLIVGGFMCFTITVASM
jgi:hypothetical protein